MWNRTDKTHLKRQQNHLLQVRSPTEQIDGSCAIPLARHKDGRNGLRSRPHQADEKALILLRKAYCCRRCATADLGCGSKPGIDRTSRVKMPSTLCKESGSVAGDAGILPATTRRANCAPFVLIATLLVFCAQAQGAPDGHATPAA